MKLKFKVQPYQTSAADSVVDCFEDLLNVTGQQADLEEWNVIFMHDF